jgi:Thiolase, N-terminal domain
MAALHAGIPIATSINTVNRQCSSGLTAVNQIANEILAGQIDIGIGMYQPCRHHLVLKLSCPSLKVPESSQ